MYSFSVLAKARRSAALCAAKSHTLNLKVPFPFSFSAKGALNIQCTDGERLYDRRKTDNKCTKNERMRKEQTMNANNTHMFTERNVITLNGLLNTNRTLLFCCKWRRSLRKDMHEYFCLVISCMEVRLNTNATESYTTERKRNETAVRQNKRNVTWTFSTQMQQNAVERKRNGNFTCASLI